MIARIALSLLLPAAWAGSAPRFDSGAVSGLPARNIGSALMCGRLSAVTGVRKDGRTTVFAGAASGGVWKSINGGTTFKPVFDRAGSLSIGAVAVDPNHPSTVWVGTGESWLRNSVSVGDGVYKSADGGENFTNVGLQDSEHIAKIIVDPSDGDTVFVCATGHAFDDSASGGVFKTTDGGKNWKRILAGANGSTGCAMLAMSSDKSLFASLWDFRRQGWTYRSGGPGGGLFKSVDGGDHWSELTPADTQGLPAKPYGRIALAVAPSNPKVVYAMIESEHSALYRSADAGKTWTKGDASQYMVWRPFYFSNLIVDPKDENKLFKTDLVLLLSNDGGKSFSSASGSSQWDLHDVWIDPENTNYVFAAGDNGLSRSADGGKRWEHMHNLPVSQFYHVSVDDADPYHVYGGLQDNGSWIGDSSYPGGVTASRWETIYGGDGFWTWNDPSDSDYIYAEAQGGYLGRVNRRTLETRVIKPYEQYGEKKLRFSWNTPIQLSPNEKGTIYIGAQFLFRSRDRGQSWERISPDITTNNPEKQKQEESGGVTIDNSAAEMHTTIYTISESPKNGKVIWVGTDDGNVQLTRDGGAHWTNLAANIPGVSSCPWVTWIEAGRFDEGTAYAALDRHMYGDMRPYVYKTADFGKTWTRIVSDQQGVRGWAHVVKEDPVDPQLLFLGTEFGLWISIDGGRRWAQYKGTDFPASVAVRDLVVQPRTSDLVLATHGRGVWIIDDVSPLRALTPELMAREAAFLPMSPAVQLMETSGGYPEGDQSFVGPSRTFEAFIPYYQRNRHIFGDMKLEVFDDQGRLIDTVPSSKHRGVNRATWAMHLKPPRVPPAASATEASIGPRIVPGVYTVKMTRGDKTYTTKLNVVLDPRAPYGVNEKKAQFELVTKLGRMLDHMTWAVESILAARDRAVAAASQVGEGDPLTGRLKRFAESADQIRRKIVATKEGGMITGEERLREFLGKLYGDVNGYDGKPTDSQQERAKVLERELEEVIAEFKTLADKELQALNGELAGKKLAGIRWTPEAEWRASQTDDGDGTPAAKRPAWEKD